MCEILSIFFIIISFVVVLHGKLDLVSNDVSHPLYEILYNNPTKSADLDFPL